MVLGLIHELRKVGFGFGQRGLAHMTIMTNASVNRKPSASAVWPSRPRAVQ